MKSCNLLTKLCPKIKTLPWHASPFAIFTADQHFLNNVLAVRGALVSSLFRFPQGFCHFLVTVSCETEMGRAEAGLQGLQQTTCSCSVLHCQKRSASQTAGPLSQLHQCAGAPADPVLFATFYIPCEKPLAIASLPETFSPRVPVVNPPLSNSNYTDNEKTNTQATNSDNTRQFLLY